MNINNKEYCTTQLLIQEQPIVLNKQRDKFESILFLEKDIDRKGEGGLRTKGYFKKSYVDKPLISIITVVYNGEKYLEETICSIMNQNYNNVEYVIIDGGSTDGTVDIIKKYEDRIDYWVSERDEGIYDAMNKGIVLSNGEIIGILNSDDYYVSYDILKVLSEHFIGLNNYYVSNTKILTENKIIDFKVLNNTGLYIQLPYMHPSTFIDKNLYKKYGLYNINYKVAADCDFLMKLLSNNEIPINLQMYSVVMRTGGESDLNYKQGRKEYKDIYIKHYNNVLKAYYGYLKSIVLRYLYQIKGNLSK